MTRLLLPESKKATIPVLSGMTRRMCGWNDFPSDYLSKKSPFTELKKAFSRRINLLCIEDNPQLCHLFCDGFFASKMLNNKPVRTFNEAIQVIRSKVRYHFWILDLTLERQNDGLELLELKPKFPFCVVVSGSQSMGSAAEAMKRGAYWTFDKSAIAFEPDVFIARSCGLMALSFILKACHSKWFDMFLLLLNEFIPTPELWSEKYCRHQQTLRTICEELTGLNIKQFLSFYHALYSTLVIDCLVDPIAGHGDIYKAFSDNGDFYFHCAEYVLSHLPELYAPLYLEK